MSNPILNDEQIDDRILIELYENRMNEFKELNFIEFKVIMTGHLSNGRHQVLMCENKPIVAGGYCPGPEGVGGVWFVPTTSIYEHKLSVYKWCHRWIDWCFIHYNLRRLETLVEAKKPVYQRFCERFGFEHEGTLRALGPNGSDYMIYSIIRKNK